MEDKCTLKNLRRRHGLTQAQAAKKLQIPLRTYAAYENDPSRTGTIKYKYLLQTLEELYRLDETHGILTLDEIRSACSSVFQKYPVHYCCLFGSYAKGSPSETSEVDLLISSDLKGLDYYGMVEELAEALRKKVDALNLEQLVGNRELLNEILKDGVRIYGTH